MNCIFFSLILLTGFISAPPIGLLPEEYILDNNFIKPDRKKDGGRTFISDFRGEKLDKTYYLILKDNGYYILNLVFSMSDVSTVALITEGRWKENPKGSIELTDRSNETKMKAIVKRDSVLQFISAFKMLVKQPFERDEMYRSTWIDHGLPFDSVLEIRQKYQEMPLVNVGNLTGRYGDTLKAFTPLLDLTNMHKYRLYNQSRSVLLSTGTWWRDKNLLILTDSIMKQNFYGLIEENGIRSMTFPGGNDGQFLRKQWK